MDPLLPRTSETLLETPIFTLLRQPTPLPWAGREQDFYVLDAPDWVNVVPLTPEGALVCVRQYRVGRREFQLEIPGGMVDPEDADAQAAGARELLEETGYAARSWQLLGVCDPNPAIQTNRLHCYLALDCEKVAAQRTDGGEQIEVELVPGAELEARVLRGEITHALVLAALYYQRLHASGRSGSGPAAPPPGS